MLAPKRSFLMVVRSDKNNAVLILAIPRRGGCHERTRAPGLRGWLVRLKAVPEGAIERAADQRASRASQPPTVAATQPGVRGLSAIARPRR